MESIPDQPTNATPPGADMMKEAALDYAITQGWPVFPLHTVIDGRCSCNNPDCKSPGKHPRTPNGFKDATTDQATISAWWSRWPGANIGFALRPGDLVIDVDPRNGGEETLAALWADHEPCYTLRSRTGSGGTHAFYHTSNPVRSGANALGPGVDIKTEGGYVVLPPSVHVKGVYRWHRRVEITEAPAWILDLLKERTPKGRFKLPGTISEGGRHTAMLSAAGAMRHMGMEEEEILASLIIANEARCTPPLGRGELESIARSVATKYEAGPLINPAKTELYRLNKDGSPGMVNPAGVAKAIMDQYDIITFIDTQEMYAYRDGIYIPKLAAAFINDFCESQLKDDATNYIVREVTGHILRSTQVERDSIKDNTEWVCVENGLLNIYTRELRPHRPGWIYLTKLPVKYDPNARAPSIEKFMREIHEKEEDVLAMYEAIGDCLIPGYPYQKGHLLVGNGSNGKTTLLNLITKLLGDENISCVAFQQLAPNVNRFSRGQLRYKLANIYDDISDREIKDDSVFKIATGGAIMDGESKNKDAFKFRNRAKFFFSCNAVPKSEDDTDAYYRRWNIYRYLKQFEGAARDENLGERITTPEELSGLLNLALDGIARLKANNGYSKKETIAQIRERYRELADTVGLFAESECIIQVNDCRVLDPETGEIKKDQNGHPIIEPQAKQKSATLYKDYLEFCTRKNQPAVSDRKFAKEILNQNPLIAHKGSRWPDGSNVKSFIGICTKTEYEKLRKTSTWQSKFDNPA